MSEVTPAAWPRKTRDLHNHHMDSTRWDGFPFREGDVVVATWAKAGTTWTQQIVCQLIHDGAEDVSAHDLAPWLELRLMPWPDTLNMLEAQTHRRLMKTHLPVDALGIDPRARYVYVGRDIRDVAWSLHNHHSSFQPEFLEVLNTGQQGPALAPANPDVRAYYNAFLDSEDGGGFWPLWSSVQGWWDARNLPNVHLVHFAKLKADPEGEIRRIAAFLDIEPSPEAWPRILEHVSFAYMKANAGRTAPMLEHVLKGGAQTFINKGENGRWRDVLSPLEISRCDEIAAARLSPDCAHWLATGELTG